MAIPLPGRDRLPPGPKRDFVEALHRLYDSAGQPAARHISKAIYKRADLESVSHETVSSTLRGTALPTWGKVQAIATVLAQWTIKQQDVERVLHDLQTVWIVARRPVSPAPPASVPVTSPIVPPPPPLALLEPFEQRPAPGEDERIVGSMPGRSAHFTGRELLLDAMAAKHQASPEAPLVLYGLGGVGKTQLAREYVNRYGGAYEVVWWVPADEVDRARTALVSLAERLGVPPRAHNEQTVTSVLQRLETRAVHYLLVYDGVEDERIRDLLPAIGGNVIVTSRDPSWAHDSGHESLEVPDFDLAEALQFLRKRDPGIDGELARELTQRLGSLPLALEQASALRHATGMPWAELMAQLDEPDPELLKDRTAPAHYPQTVSASLTFALDQLRRDNPFAAQVYELFAWFGTEPVSLPLLRRGGKGEVPSGLKRALNNPIELNKAVEAISRYGLGRLHTADQRVEVQPLMRLVLRERLSEESRRRALVNVQAILTEAGKGWPDTLGHLDMHRFVAPHVLPARLVHARRSETAQVVLNQIRYRYLIGDYEDARRLGEAAVTAWRVPEFLGPDHELVLRAGREWANALRSLGRYQQAREITADAMERLRNNPRFPDDHPYALEVARSYAADLRIAGKYREALDLDEASYERHLRHHPPGDDRTVSSRHNLAVCLRLLGDFVAAEAIDREEVTFQRARRGETDRRTLLSVNALAEDLFGQGKFVEVIQVQSAALEACRPALGSGDRAVLLARRMVALAYRRLGQFGTAADLLQSTYQDGVESWGADHEFTLAVTMSYANALLARGRVGEAYSLAVDTVGGYERAFGETNPLTLAVRVNLAVTLRAQGERHEARRVDDAALAGLREAVGERHPFTIAAMTNLASDLAYDGDRAGAHHLSLLAWQHSSEVRGPHHFDTLAAAANLVLDRADATAESGGPPLDEVIGGLRRSIGPRHPVVAGVAGGARVECDVEPPST